MGETLVEEVGYEIGSSNGSSDGVGGVNSEVSPLGESPDADGGSERGSSNGRSVVEVSIDLEVFLVVSDKVVSGTKGGHGSRNALYGRGCGGNC